MGAARQHGSCAPPMLPLPGGVALAEMAAVAAGARGEHVGGHLLCSGKRAAWFFSPATPLMHQEAQQQLSLGKRKAVGSRAHKSPSPGASPSAPEPADPCGKRGAGPRGRPECILGALKARLPCIRGAAGRQQEGLEIAASLICSLGTAPPLMLRGSFCSPRESPRGAAVTVCKCLCVGRCVVTDRALPWVGGTWQEAALSAWT